MWRGAAMFGSPGAGRPPPQGVPLDSTGSQLLFRLVAAAYERRSLAIASHWLFEEWGRFLPNHSTAVSLVDRLLHHSNIVATDGKSYRMREARVAERYPLGVRRIRRRAASAVSSALGRVCRYFPVVTMLP